MDAGSYVLQLKHQLESSPATVGRNKGISGDDFNWDLQHCTIPARSLLEHVLQGAMHRKTLPTRVQATAALQQGNDSRRRSWREHCKYSKEGYNATKESSVSYSLLKLLKKK